ncbi:MAG: thioredoxin family protein [Desulfobulbaceae bacterium]|nr:thioredoxin family protein [Desulfobulbaceae bacterium]
MDDIPLQRNLKVGAVSIGLIGLDVAFTRVLAQPELALAEAVELVYAEIAHHNYIPQVAEAKYRHALEEEIVRLRQGGSFSGGPLEVRILGTGCVSCNNLQRVVIEIMATRQIAADVFQVHDPDEIGRFGVLQTPALVVNGKVKSIGRLPTPAEIEEWLVDAASFDDKGLAPPAKQG